MKKLFTTLGVAGLLVGGLASPADAKSNNVHVIENGDTFWVLALENEVGLTELMNMNPDKDALNLQVGEEIVLPDESTPVKSKSEGKSKKEEEVTSVTSSAWDRIAECESGGDWSINTGNSYFGGVQFLKTSWDAMGGQEFAAYPHHASKAEQIIVAERLLEVQGWGAWPVCSAKAGLR